MTEGNRPWTEGPWEKRRQSNTIAQVGGKVVCDLNGVGGHDASLIAAAPEMFDVLERLVNGTADIDTIYEDARQVLSKARGETND